MRPSESTEPFVILPKAALTRLSIGLTYLPQLEQPTALIGAPMLAASVAASVFAISQAEELPGWNL